MILRLSTVLLASVGATAILAGPGALAAMQVGHLPAPGDSADDAGWFMDGMSRDAYRVESDGAVRRDGKPSLRLESTEDTSGGYGTWMRSINAVGYLGQRVRVSAYTRTEGATERADFWARVQGADSPGDGLGLGGQQLDVRADAHWARHEIVLDVDQAGMSLQYGVGLAGPGMLWLEGATIEVVGMDVPLTAEPSAKQPAHHQRDSAPDSASLGRR